MEEPATATAAISKLSGAKKSNKKRNRNQSNSLSSSSSSSEGIQPDPRWADKLAQLKEMLAAANH
jgi:hypothetical protein